MIQIAAIVKVVAQNTDGHVAFGRHAAQTGVGKAQFLQPLDHAVGNLAFLFVAFGGLRSAQALNLAGISSVE